MEDLRQLDLKETEIQSIGLQILEDVLDAHYRGNYAKLEKHLSEDAKTKLTHAIFSEMVEGHCKALGKPSDVLWLGAIEKQARTQTTWKVKYESSAKEMNWQMFLGTDGKDTKIDGLWLSYV